jgi:hypothetical protein
MMSAIPTIAAEKAHTSKSSNTNGKSKSVRQQTERAFFSALRLRS